jgi:hypothetical protein
MEHLISNANHDGEGHLGAVFGKVVIHTEWLLTEGRIDDSHDRSCHVTRVGALAFLAGKSADQIHDGNAIVEPLPESGGGR